MTTACAEPKIDRGFQGLFRPMVATAWHQHCRLFSIDPTDKIAKEAWYRDALRTAAGVTSTRELTADQQKRVLNHFAYLARGCDAPPVQAPARPERLAVNGWTSAQVDRFSELAPKAWRADRARRKEPTAPFEGWWRFEFERVLKGPPEGMPGPFGSCHQWTTVKDFDAIMEHFAVIAQDAFWMRRASECSERRMRMQLKRFLVDLAWIEFRYSVSWEYVRSIYDHSDLLPHELEDCPAKTLRLVLGMLDTRIRKLCRDHNLRPCFLPSREPINRDLWIEWRGFHGGPIKRWPNDEAIHMELGVHSCGCAIGQRTELSEKRCLGCGAVMEERP